MFIITPRRKTFKNSRHGKNVRTCLVQHPLNQRERERMRDREREGGGREREGRGKGERAE